MTDSAPIAPSVLMPAGDVSVASVTSAASATSAISVASTTSNERAQPFAIPVRIYYEDTDVGGVVYYANYLRFLERARTEWLRAAGFELDVIQRDMKAVFVVRRVEADYHLPALLGNLITVTAEPTEVGASRLVIRQRVLRAREPAAGGADISASPLSLPSPASQGRLAAASDELLLSATVTLAFIASDLSGPIRMPAVLRAAMKSTLPPVAKSVA